MTHRSNAGGSAPSAALRVRAGRGMRVRAGRGMRVRAGRGMCVAPHVKIPVAVATTRTSVSTVSATNGQPRRKKLKWRTRDSQSSKLYNLQLDIQSVQQQIRSLLEYRDLLAARTLNRQDDLDGRYVRFVIEYHRVFERGYHPLPASKGVIGGGRLDARRFLMNLTADDLQIGRYAGRDVLLDQWEQYTHALTGLEFRYKGSRVVQGTDFTIVISRSMYKHLVSLDTIKAMFPHLLRDHPAIVNKLLGMTLEGEGEFTFTFNTSSDRVVNFEFNLGYMELFAQLLHNIQDLDAVFSSAPFSEEYLIGDVKAYDAYLRDQSRREQQRIAWSQEQELQQPVSQKRRRPIWEDGADAETKWPDPRSLEWSEHKVEEELSFRASSDVGWGSQNSQDFYFGGPPAAFS